jgi:hypothetical protein
MTTLSFNDGLSATQPAWSGQSARQPAHPLTEQTAFTDARIAQRRFTGTWLTEGEVLQGMADDE